VGDKSLLEYQLTMCVEAGIDEVIVVTGFGTRAVDEVIERWQKKDVRVKNVYNPFFSVSDNLASCWFVRAEMKGDFILLNGDTVFEFDVLKTLLDSPAAPITVTIDKKSRYDADDMKVGLDQDCVTAISKELLQGSAHAESIGMLSFRGEGPGLFVETLENDMRQDSGLRSWFLKAIDQLAGTGVVKACSIEGRRWAELDTPADLEVVRSLFE